MTQWMGRGPGANRHELTVSAQPVGHGATTALNGTVLICTRELRGIGVDVENRVARVGAEPYQLFCLRVPVTPQVGRGSVASTKQPSRTLLGNAVGDLLGAEAQAAPVARPTGQ